MFEAVREMVQPFIVERNAEVRSHVATKQASPRRVNGAPRRQRYEAVVRLMRLKGGFQRRCSTDALFPGGEKTKQLLLFVLLDSKKREDVTYNINVYVCIHIYIYMYIYSKQEPTIRNQVKSLQTI